MPREDSLVPFAEDAANAAGDYLARSGPEFVRETIVPSFIAGFQDAQKSAGDDAVGLAARSRFDAAPVSRPALPSALSTLLA